MKTYSTPEVAKMLGLHRPHLQRAIAQGRITAPPLIHAGPVKARVWTLRDVERARRELKATRNGRKRRVRRGGGR